MDRKLIASACIGVVVAGGLGVGWWRDHADLTARLDGFMSDRRDVGEVCEAARQARLAVGRARSAAAEASDRDYRAAAEAIDMPRFVERSTAIDWFVERTGAAADFLRAAGADVSEADDRAGEADDAAEAVLAICNR